MKWKLYDENTILRRNIYMIKTGIIRKFDDLGRIVIPRSVRQEVFGTSKNEGKLMEIFYEKNGIIILKPVKEN